MRSFLFNNTFNCPHTVLPPLIVMFIFYCLCESPSYCELIAHRGRSFGLPAFCGWSQWTTCLFCWMVCFKMEAEFCSVSILSPHLFIAHLKMSGSTFFFFWFKTKELPNRRICIVFGNRSGYLSCWSSGHMGNYLQPHIMLLHIFDVLQQCSEA